MTRASQIGFSLFRDSLAPGWSPAAGGQHDALWRNPAQSLNWTGLLDGQRGSLVPLPGQAPTFSSAIGSLDFTQIGFTGATMRGASVVSLDWSADGRSARLNLDAAWNSIKNASVSTFDGTRLEIRNFVDAWVNLDNDFGQTVILEGAKRGEVTLGSGDDRVELGIDSNSSGWTNAFLVQTGAGDDVLVIRASNYNAVGGAYDGRWTTVTASLGEGDDVVQGGFARREVLDGGEGFDVLVLSSLRSGWRVVEAGGSVSLVGNGRSVTLTGFESVVFTDGELLLGGGPGPAPVATTDTYAAVEDTALSVAAASGVLANDSGAGLRVQAGTLTTTAGATVTLREDGSFDYSPAAHANGPDSFAYRAIDRFGREVTGEARITVAAVNDAPETTAVAIGAAPRSVVQGRLLADDVDSDDDPGSLTYEIVTGPGAGQGSLGLLAGGTFLFDTGTDFDGLLRGLVAEVVVTWRAVDRHGAASADQILTVAVTGTAIAPPVITGIAEDTGTPGDGITADRSLTLLGRADSDAVVDVYRGATLLGTATVAPDGSWSFAVPGDLADGTYDFSAVARVGRRSSATSDSLEVTVDGTAPVWGVGFAAPVAMLPGVEARRMQLEDMNGDGHVDIVRAESDGRLVVDLNDGQGNFRRSADIEGSDDATSFEFRIGDMNGDGIKDIVTSDGAAVRLLLGRGDGSFEAPLIVGTASDIAALDIGDLDRDGKMDIAFLRFAYELGNFGDSPQHQLRILSNLDGTTFEQTGNHLIQPGDFSPHVGNIRIGQFNADGAPDVWLTVMVQSVALNAGDGTFRVEYTDLSGNWPGRSLGWGAQVEMADFDGDGVDDPVSVITVAGGGTVPVRIIMSAGPDIRFEFAPGQYGLLAGGTAAADLDGDGDQDLVFIGVASPGGHVTVALNDGTGGFSAPFTYRLDVRPGSVDIADLDGDGRPDMLLGSGHNLHYRSDFDDLRFYRNTSTGITGVGPDTGRSATDGVTAEAITLVRGFAEAGSAVRVFRDGIEIGAGIADATTGAFAITLATPLGAGQHALTAVATDAAGNVSAPSPAYLAVVDQTAEIPVIDGLYADLGRSTNDLITNGQVTDVVGLAEAGAVVELFVDGERISTDTAKPSGRFWLAGVDAFDADGAYSVSVRMTDKAGNVASSAVTTIVIDRTAPDAPLLSGIGPDTGRDGADGITAAPVTSVRGMAEPDSLVEIRAGRPYPVYDPLLPDDYRLVPPELIGSARADASGAFTVTFNRPIDAEGVTRLTATATDAAGNVSATSAVFTVDLDRSAPEVGSGLGSARGYASTGPVKALAINDVDGDGLVDILTSRDGYLVTLHGAGDGRFEAPTTVSTTALDPTTLLPFGDGVAMVYDSGGFPIFSLETWIAPGVLAGSGVGSFGITQIVSQDFTGDGITDIAAAGYWGLRLFTLAPDGSITTAEVAPPSAVADISAIATGDLTGDGVADILVAVNGLANTFDTYIELPSYLRLFRGLGDGTFAAPVSTLVDVAPTGIVLGDLNGDGRADMVLLPPVRHPFTGEQPLTLSILLTGAGGAPGTPTVFTLPAMPVQVAIGDVDGDGDADILAAFGTAGLRVLHNDGQGIFSAPVTFTVPGLADVRTINFADINGDGRTDLVAGGDGGIVIMLAAPPGITQARMLDGVPVVQGEVEPHGLVALFDGATPLGTATAGADGRFTLALAAPLATGAHSLAITVTDRAGNVSAPSTPFLLTIPAVPTPPAITETNADGDPADLGGATRGPVTALRGTAEPNSFVVILADGQEVGGAMAGADGQFHVILTQPLVAEGTYLFQAVASDLSGRLLPADDSVEVVLDRTAPGAPSITGIGPDDSGDSATDGITAATVSLVHGTAEPDSLVTIYSGLPRALPGGGEAREPIGTARADGDGNFTVILDRPLAADGLYRLTATATDRAGNPSAEAAAFEVVVDKAPPEMGAGYSAPIPAALGTLRDTAFADLDGDGRLDLLLAGTEGLEIRLGDGAGRFGPGAALLPATGLQSLAVGDVDGDGRADVVATTDAGAVLLFEGRAGGVPGLPEALPGVAATRVFAADLSNDGRADLLLTSALPGGGTAVSLLVARHDGSGFLAPRTVFTTTGDIAGLHLADLGNPDINGTLDFGTGEFTQDPVLPDGVLDLAVLAGDGTATVLWGRLSGSFGWVPDGVPAQAAAASGVVFATGALNGGAPDLVIGRGGAAPSVSVFFSDDLAGFLPPVTIALTAAPTAMALADMDQDGALDLVVALGALDAVAVLRGDGAGGFLAPVQHATVDNPMALRIADLNGDGRPDIATRGTEGLSLLLTMPEGLTGIMALDGGFAASGQVEPGAGITILAEGVVLATGRADDVTGAFLLPLSPAAGTTELDLLVTDLAGNQAEASFDIAAITGAPPPGLFDPFG